MFSSTLSRPPPELISTRLSHIIVECIFHHPLSRVPSSLTHLTFKDASIIQSFWNFSSITHLSVQYSYANLFNNLPPNLVYLSVNYLRDFPPKISLPLSLKYFVINGMDWKDYHFSSPPPAVSEGGPYLYSVNDNVIISYDSLPPALTHLVTYGSAPVDNLPLSLTHLFITSPYFFRSLDNLPLSLRHLILPGSYNKPLANLPPNLTHLTTGVKFNYPLDSLPPSLTHLLLNLSFSHPVDNLPGSLTFLSMKRCEYFKHPLDRLPQSLTVLSLPRSYNHPSNHLPTSLVYLSFSYSYSHSLPHPSRLSKLKTLVLMGDHHILIPPLSTLHTLHVGARYPIKQLPCKDTHFPNLQFLKKGNFKTQHKAFMRYPSFPSTRNPLPPDYFT